MPRYEELHAIEQLRTPELIQRGLEAEFDKFTIWPQGRYRARRMSGTLRDFAPEMGHVNFKRMLPFI